ncbi:flowering time control protein FCA isoform X2 [Gossypium raimondii]|uniref:flowering time control protein FCA isoform X2 n=1 Tax=Gossypium raimondii TaxID=29730 RepID=UPI00227B1C14|nr:flowering time control protein FCA isoform X2 [Gossypium raimondii]
MERHRDRGERFNDHPPLNPTPWYTNAQRPNFPPDYHHQHHYHPYNHHHNPQQFDYCPTQQQFDHLPAQQQFDHRPTQQPFEHRPTQQQFDHRPNQQPFEHRPNQQPFEHRPNQQQFDHRPTQQQFEHQSSQQQFEHQPGNQHHFERFPEQHQQPISEQNDAFWSNGGNGPNAGRKRGFHDSGRGASPDHNEGSSLAKLYIATVPKTATEESIRFMFQEHGNVVEVIQPKDKKTGERHGYCFVKYAMFEEAERAIAALNNRYMFPGESTTIKVRYADAERDRPDKLYVGCLNKQASKREIEEIFSHYGHVLDVFIMRDEHREHRGCGFVQFSQRDMAQAAIRGLSGIFTMKGCDQPLIVRSANPKRPRNGEPRGNYAFNSMPSGPHLQELAMRSMPNLGDSMAGHIPPNASYPGQHISTNPQPQGVSHWANPQVAACHVTYQSYPPVQQAHSQPTSLPSQQTQTLQGSSQSSHPADSEQKQQPLIPPASQVPSQQNGNVPKLESPQTGSSQPIAATSVVPIVPQSLETVALQESDWSEHTCPEGNKYYYNCVTCESRWNKPEEFALFEKLLQKQQKVQNPSQHIQPDSTGPSVKQVSQSQEVQLQTYPMHLKLEVEQPFSTLGMDHMEIKSETSPVVDLTCV